MKKEIVTILLLLALIGMMIETVPLNTTTQAFGKILEEQLPMFQRFRLLAVEGYWKGVTLMRSAEYFIETLRNFPNWNNITFPSYIELLSWYNETEIIDECKEFYSGNATKFNVQRLIRDFLGQTSANEFAIFYIMTEGRLSKLFLDDIITSSELQSWLGTLQCTVCVVIDACYSGSWINDGAGSTFGQNRIVLCSSRSDQLSWGKTEPYLGGDFTGFESIRYPNGTFLPIGLIGSTIAGKDLNDDGWLSVLECFAYAQVSVQQFYPEDSKYHQDPVAFNGLPDNYDPPLVQLPLEPPIAKFSYNPQVAWPNEIMTFNASDSNGSIATYGWNFGDSNITTVSEPLITHTYSSAGNCTVTLNVTDVYDQWNATTRTITITFVSDLNKDRTVNILDITIVAASYNTRPGDEKWNATADLDKNGTINILDVTMVAKDYGKTV
jgi:hypothetical protein